MLGIFRRAPYDFVEWRVFGLHSGLDDGGVLSDKSEGPVASIHGGVV